MVLTAYNGVDLTIPCCCWLMLLIAMVEPGGADKFHSTVGRPYRCRESAKCTVAWLMLQCASLPYAVNTRQMVNKRVHGSSRAVSKITEPITTGKIKARETFRQTCSFKLTHSKHNETPRQLLLVAHIPV